MRNNQLSTESPDEWKGNSNVEDKKHSLGGEGVYISKVLCMGAQQL